MGYQLFDVNDFVGDFSTTLGLKELRMAVERRRKRYPNLHEFIIEGASLLTDELVREVKEFIRKEKGLVNVRKTLQSLSEMMEESDLAVYISAE